MAWYLIKHRDNFTFTCTIQNVKHMGIKDVKVDAKLLLVGISHYK
jgi:hypothetical protein